MRSGTVTWVFKQKIGLDWCMIAGLDLSLFVACVLNSTPGSPQIYGSVKANSGVSFCKGHLLVWGLVVPGSETHFRYAPPSSPGDNTVLLRTLQTLPPSCSSCLCIHPFCSQAKQALLSLRPSTQCCTVSTFLNRHPPACQLASVACCSAAHPESQGLSSHLWLPRVPVLLLHPEPGKWLSGDFPSYRGTSNAVREVLGPSEEHP